MSEIKMKINSDGEVLVSCDNVEDAKSLLGQLKNNENNTNKKIKGDEDENEIEKSLVNIKREDVEFILENKHIGLSDLTKYEKFKKIWPKESTRRTMISYIINNNDKLPVKIKEILKEVNGEKKEIKKRHKISKRGLTKEDVIFILKNKDKTIAEIATTPKILEIWPKKRTAEGVVGNIKNKRFDKIGKRIKNVVLEAIDELEEKNKNKTSIEQEKTEKPKGIFNF